MKFIGNLRNSKAAITITGIVCILSGLFEIINVNSGMSFGYNLYVIALFILYLATGIIMFTKKFTLIKYASIFYLLLFLISSIAFNTFGVYSLMEIIFWIGVILMAYVEELKKYNLYLLILPVISSLLLFIRFISSFFDEVYWTFDFSWIFVIIITLIGIITALLFQIMICLLVNQKDGQIIETSKNSKNKENEEYCNMVSFILLMLFTFGIYQLCWIHKVTRLTNQCKSEEYRNPTNKLLLCMFVPFYSIYWTYQTAKRIDKLCNSDIATISLVLSFLIPFVPPLLIQSTMNDGFKNDNQKEKTEKKNSKDDFLSIAESIGKYKELLDNGAINEKEYEDMKRKLLKDRNS